MTLDEKLNVFYDSTIEDATKKSEEILIEYKETLKNIYEEHKKETEERAVFSLEVETKKLLQEKNKVLSVQSLDFKRQINEKTESLKKILFKDVKKSLAAFMEKEEYKDLLVIQIKDSAAFSNGDTMTIYINASDTDKKSFLEEKSGFPVTISAIDFMGGTRAVIHERNVLIDHSFSSKFIEEKELFSL